MNSLDNITMVSASAGTGKTYYLTNAIAAKIGEGVPASAIMATTFTKKAAGELKERIAAKLLATPTDGQDVQMLREGAQQLSVSLIGTINSVCSRLLKEYAIDAGLSPALEAIAEEQQSGIFRLATDGVLADYAPQILPLAQRLSQLEDDGAWDKTVRAICDAARNNLLSSEELAQCAERSWRGFRELLDDPATDERATWLHGFRQCMEELRAVIRDGVDSAGKPVNTSAKNFAGVHPEISRRVSALDSVDRISWEQWRGVVPSGASALIKRIFEGPTTAFKDGLLGNPAFHDDVEQFIRLVFDCAAECLEAFSEFKRQHGLIDFVDQETLVVNLLHTNEGFRTSIRQRVKFLVVDEFQDTSPLQLELFLQLSQLVEDVVWVGDPKQAIYEFRGTDPELMNAVVTAVEHKDRLEHSWRSRQSVIDLSNAVFEPIFGLAGMPRESVHLRLPKEHGHWTAGSLEAWTRDQSKDGERLSATAAGVADLLNRRPELKPCDVAVLARSNADASAIADALAALGIRASLNQKSLLEAREVQLVRAAMAFVADERDTVALTEIVALHPDHQAHLDWQPRLLSAKDSTVILTAWATDPLLQPLAMLRERAGRATPTEIFEEVVGLLGLPQLIKSWSQPATRFRNLDAVRASLNNYYESCKALKKPGTLRGYLGFLAEEDQTGAENSGTDVVNVLTYHKAKGLEWPVVVMESLDKKISGRTFGTAVEQDGELKMDSPLQGRWIRFWPSPFPYNGSPLDQAASSTEVASRSEDRERRNLARLMYVGMTRSATTTILTGKKAEPSSLNSLGVENLVSWSGSADAGRIQVAGTPSHLPADTYSYAPAEAVIADAGAAPVQYTDQPSARLVEVSYPPARVQASKEESIGISADIIDKADLGERLIPHGDKGWDAVGSAIHAYLGTSYEALSADERLGLAKQIIDRWEVGDLVNAEVIVASGDRLSCFVATDYPDAAQFREVPIGWRNNQNQVMEGWIDLLLETSDGYILVDHKTYPGTDPVDHIREKYLGQMDTYRLAILAATGKPVVETLIHLPALGKVYEIVSEMGESNLTAAVQAAHFETR